MLRKICSSNLGKQRCILRNAIGSSRFLSDDKVPDLDISHYTGEWKTYGDIEQYTPGKFVIQTFNKISQKGLRRFDEDSYEVGSSGNAHALLLRSHKLQEDEVLHTVRAIAR